MFFTRSLPLLISIVVSTGLWVLGILLLQQEHSSQREPYAVLICRGAASDREIRECLENQGFTGLVSESTQRVLLDSFGSIEQIPLDEYDMRILPFDPRNDGYAEKLRSLFVQDDRRFTYIPQKTFRFSFEFPAGMAIVERRIAVALGDIQYSFEYKKSSRPVFLFLAVLCLAACAFFIVPPLRRSLQPHAAILLPCLPALAPLALGGAAGFALASLLAGFAVLLVVFFEQFSLLRSHELPYVLYRLLLSALLGCYGILAFFSGLSLFFTLPVLAVFCGILAFSLRGASRTFGLLFMRQNAEHQRFAPVPILKRRVSGFAFLWAMLPFAAAALVPALADITVSASSPETFTKLPAAAVTEADYRTHFLFQSTFSQRNLHTQPPEASGMSIYELDPDGLLEYITSDGPADAPLSGIPPFPLGDLLSYLNRSSHNTVITHEMFAVILPLLFIIPALFLWFLPISSASWYNRIIQKNNLRFRV